MDSIRWKRLHLLYLLITIIIFISCSQHSKSDINIYNKIQIEEFDNFYNNLSQTDIYNLSSDELVLWCLQHCFLAEQLKKQSPNTLIIEKVKDYIVKNDLPCKADIYYYLAKAYMEEKNNAEAMNHFLISLDYSNKTGDYNLSGYINSYLADLYDLSDCPREAFEKYSEAASYFKKANNHISEALAYRDIGYTCILLDSLDLASYFLKRAESLAISNNDSVAVASIYTVISALHETNGEPYEAIEYQKHLLKWEITEKASTLLALSGIFESMGRIDSALYYLNRADKEKVKNERIPVAILYQYYNLFKKNHEYEKSLFYLERFQLAMDSISESNINSQIYSIENKYNYIGAINKLDKVLIEKQKNIIFAFAAIIVLLIITLIEQKLIKKKNSKISELSKILYEKRNELEFLRTELEEGKIIQENNIDLVTQEKIIQNKRNEIIALDQTLQQLRAENLKKSAIYKKIHSYADKIDPQKNKKFTENDWMKLMKVINDNYPMLFNRLITRHHDMTKADIQTCYFILFDLDITAQSILLNCNIEAINKRLYRLRLKLKLSGQDLPIKDYLLSLDSLIS